LSCYLSTSCFGNTLVSDAIRNCHNLGTKNIELSAPHKFQNINNLEKELYKYNDNGFFFTLHNYFPTPEKSFVLNLATNDELSMESNLNLIENVKRLCLASKSPLYGIHAGYLRQAKPSNDGMFIFEKESISYSKALNLSVAFVNKIAPSFEELGLKLLIENLFPSPKIKHSLFCSFEEISEYMSQIPKSVGILLDLAHMKISSNIYGFNKDLFLESFMMNFADRLYEVHISDNDGIKDQHLGIKENSWVINAIKLIKQDNSLIDLERIFCLECHNASTDQITKSLNLINQIIA